LLVTEGGDLSLYEDTGTTPKFIWDSSAESLGIGTTPATTLHVYDTINNYITLEADGATRYAGLVLKNSVQSWRVQTHGGDAGFKIHNDTTNNTALSINTSNNVGIGVVPSAWHSTYAGALQMKGGSLFTATTQTYLTHNLVYTTNWKAVNTSASTAYLQSAGGHTWMTAPSVSAGATASPTAKMTLDANGNLLVGKTSTSGGIAGTVLAASGLTRLTASGIAVAEINRLSSDGSVVDFKKDGATVGIFGTVSGDMVVGTGNTGLRFYDAGRAIQPRHTDGTAANDVIDLGMSTNRFKDLYLSGGVYLGGTGASNLLEDYEEGTWTPALGGTWATNPTNLSGTYTKVGRVVTITMSFSGGAKSSTLAGYFTGLPIAMIKNGTGVVIDTGIVSQGVCAFANTDRVWVTDNALGTSNYLTGQYITA